MAKNKILQAVVEIAGSVSPTLSKAVEETAGKLDKVNLKAAAVGAACAAGAVAVGKAAIDAGKYLIDLGGQFDEVQDAIRIGTGATGDALNDLMADFDAVYSSVPTTMEDAGKAIADYNTRLGLTGDNLQKISVQAIQVADMLGEDLGDVIESSSKAFQQWNIDAEDMGDAMDYVFKAAQSTGVGFSELMSGVQQYGAQLQEMGYSFEQATALIGQLEKAGVNTSEVLGAMKKSVGALAAEGIDAADGLQMYVDAITDAKDMTQATAIAAEVFGSKAASTMAAAIRDGTIAVDDLTASLLENNETINGCAEDTYDFAERLQLFKQKAQVALEPLASTMFDSLNELMPIVGELMDGLIPIIKDMTATLTPLIKDLVAKIGPMLQNLVPPLLRVASSILQKVIPPLVEIIDSVIPVLIQLVEMLMPIVEFIAEDILPAVCEILGPILDLISSALDPLISVLTNLIKFALEPLKPLINLLANLFEGVLGSAIQAIMPVVEALQQIFGGLITFITSVFKGDWEGAWSGIKDFFAGIWNGLKAIVQAPIEFISNLVGNLGETIKNVFSGAWEKVKGIWAGVGDFFSGIWNGIKNAFSAVTEWFGNIFRNAWEAVKNVFSAGGKIFEGIKDGILSAFKNVVNAIIRGINKVIAIPFNGINAALEKIKGVEILGWKPFDWIKTFNVPQIPELAAGGFTEGVSIAGEAGTEAVISFDPAYRDENIKTWTAAGKLLGVLGDLDLRAGAETATAASVQMIESEPRDTEAPLIQQAGRLMSLDDFTLGELTETTIIYYDFSGFTWSPHIEGISGQEKEDVLAALKENENEFFDWLEEWIRRKEVGRYDRVSVY